MNNLDRQMQQGLEIAEKVLSATRYPFAVIKPSQTPDDPGVNGVYIIRLQDSGETPYVGQTKNLRQRIYSNHLQCPLSNARLKKYLIEDPNEPSITDLAAAKQYLKDCCYVQFQVINDLL